ncbi:ribonuclease HII [Flavobacteriaceae bacterium]|jgi:ribonuclease HII|nr:ribonuclease HII [Flavobacteriaceae bacterium]MDC0386455.1 ribonuclease HII [Flavobacteriaceae bacterium]MDC0872891.1 ribonuclease HII [Flavobacteriaceae bacterium]MDC3241270.1 ribonuclease HII [Flavobacteriaceae bacterium]
MLSIQLTNFIEAGTDEAGRGCLAGPVTAAAVILPQDLNLPFLNDSKKLTEKQRNILRPQIENQAIAFSVAHVFQEEIDRINILKASIKAMHLALEQLQKSPEYIVVDGNKFFSFNEIPHQCIVKGDGKFQNIAAASVLAKTYRDDYMKKINADFPVYGWDQNKGYPTQSHRAAIQKYGSTPHHRKSFQLLPRQLEIDF